MEEEYLEKVRSYGDTEPSRKAIRKRAVWVEPLFAEAKDWHGARRFRLRRLEKVNAEALLIAAGQNVKRLLTFSERGPRRGAQVAALRQPAPHPYEFCGVRKHRGRCSRSPARFFNTLRCSRKSISRILHSPSPIEPETADSPGPAPYPKPYISWWCIKMQHDE